MKPTKMGSFIICEAVEYIPTHMTEGEIHPKLIDFGLVKEAE